MMKKYVLSDTVKYLSFPFEISKAEVESCFELHTHDFSELVFVLSGSATHIVDIGEYPICAGDVFLINGNTAHGFKDASALSLYNIKYHPEKFISLTSSLKRISGFQALFILEPFYRQSQHLWYKFELDRDSMKYVRELAELMLQEFNTMREGYELVIHSCFIELVVYLSRQYAKKATGLRSRILCLAEVLAYIESNYREPMKLDELAGRANMSARHFIRVFKQSYKRTPLDYILNLRLKHALELLGNPDLTITEIALLSGFSDSNYFIRQFRKVYGLTPGACRKLR